MPTIYLRPTEPQKKKLARLAKVAKRSENAYMLHLLDQVESTQEQPTVQRCDVDDTDRAVKRLTVRVPHIIEQAIEERAKRKGMTKARWVSALVQSHLLCDPVMTDAELAVLEANRRELVAIGRNVNQMTKSLHEHAHDTELVRLKLLAELSEVIQRNREAIRALARASHNAWEVIEWR